MARETDGAQRCIPAQHPQQMLFNLHVSKAHIHQAKCECQSCLRAAIVMLSPIVNSFPSSWLLCLLHTHKQAELYKTETKTVSDITLRVQADPVKHF